MTVFIASTIKIPSYFQFRVRSDNLITPLFQDRAVSRKERKNRNAAYTMLGVHATFDSDE